jgi:hypothetical protein
LITLAFGILGARRALQAYWGWNSGIGPIIVALMRGLNLFIVGYSRSVGEGIASMHHADDRMKIADRLACPFVMQAVMLVPRLSFLHEEMKKAASIKIKKEGRKKRSSGDDSERSLES